MADTTAVQHTLTRETDNTKNYKPITRACTTCRQSKVKCNLAETFPGPCQRCHRLRKECRSDPTFKRTRVRGRLEEVTKQLDRIQREQSQEELSKRSASEAPCSELSLPNNPSPIQNESHVFNLHQVDEQCSQVSTQELGGVQVKSSDIVELFKYFSSHYLRIYPILDTRMTINNLHQKNSLLFWTIVVIACRYHPILKHYSEKLTEPYQTLLSEILAGPLRSVYTVHSLLLFCLWPLPVQKQILDPSWNYCGIAVSAALRMGLHSNHAPWEYGLQKFSVEDIELRRRTWLTCFMVSTFLSTDLGLPLPMTQGSEFNIMLQEWLSYNSENTLAIHVEIQHHVARFSSMLSEPSGSLIRSPLILMFDHELEVLGSRVARTEGQLTQITYLGARLRLYSFSLLFESKNTDIPGQNYIDSSRKTIWYLGLETAVRLVYLFSSTCNSESTPLKLNPTSQTTTLQNSHRFYPKHAFFLLVNAGLYLLKFLFVNDDATSSEKDLARDHVRLTHSCLLKWSRHERDESDRVARVISLLANAEVQGKLKEVCKNTRPGATLFADGMRMVIWLRAQNKDAAAQQVVPGSPNSVKVSAATVENAISTRPKVTNDNSGTTSSAPRGEIVENWSVVGMNADTQQMTFEQENELAQTTMMDCLMPDDDLSWEGLDDWWREDFQFGVPLEDSFGVMAS